VKKIRVPDWYGQRLYPQFRIGNALPHGASIMTAPNLCGVGVFTRR
jgi:hypothetical protein